MKLYEIVSTTRTEEPVKPFNIKRLQKRASDLAYSLDPKVGAYAEFKPHADPHETDDVETQATGKKVYHVPDKEHKDAYHGYVEELIQSNLMGANPYFPRIYNINTKKDPKGHKRPEFNMERLTRGIDVPTEELVAVLDREFSGDFPKGFYQNQEGDNKLVNQQLRGQVLTHIAKKLRDAFIDSTDINSDELRDAIAFIHRVMKKNNTFKLDIHRENFMFRRTPHGLQLVLTDPLQDVDLPKDM